MGLLTSQTYSKAAYKLVPSCTLKSERELKILFLSGTESRMHRHEETEKVHPYTLRVIIAGNIVFGATMNGYQLENGFSA